MSRVRYYKTTSQRVGNTTYKTVQSRRWGGPYNQPSGIGAVIVLCLVLVFLFWPATLHVPTWAKWVLEILWLLALVLFAAILAEHKKTSAAKPKLQKPAAPTPNAVRAPKLPAPPSSQTRVSDAERTQVTDALSDQFAKGLLDLNELNKRVDHALRAKTGGDLAVALFDLPNGGQKAEGENEARTTVSPATTPSEVRTALSNLSAKPTPDSVKKAPVPPVRTPTAPGGIAVPHRRRVSPPAQPVPQKPASAPSSFMPPPLRQMWARISDQPYPEIGTPAFEALLQLWREEYKRLHDMPEYKAAVEKEYERLKNAAKPSQSKEKEN